MACQLIRARVEQGQSSAHQAACLNNLRQLSIANVMYAGDHEDQAFPSSTCAATKAPSSGWPTRSSAPQSAIPKTPTPSCRLRRSSVVPPISRFSIPGSTPTPTIRASERGKHRNARQLQLQLRGLVPLRGRSWALASADHAGHKLGTSRSPPASSCSTTARIGGPNGRAPITSTAGTSCVRKGSVQAYKDAGCGGPTLYRHNEGANLAFYDGHAERMAKEKVWIPDHFYSTPKQPGMWVARSKSGSPSAEVWESYR
jgi:prepilin-type processing-associated H-X9-DG protein